MAEPPPRKERKWSKHIQSSIPTLEVTNKLVETPPATEKQLQYIRMLEERNRIKKKMEEQSKNEKDIHEKDRESGFTTNFNGENATRKPQLLHHQAKGSLKRAKSAGATKMRIGTSVNDDCLQKSEPKRDVRSAGLMPSVSSNAGEPLRPKQKWTKYDDDCKTKHNTVHVFERNPRVISNNL